MAAELSTFTTNRDATRAGEWIEVGLGQDRFEIRTRGFTPAYRDGLSKLRREAARELNRRLKPGDMPVTPDTLPPTADDRCTGNALADHCVLDVRGLTSGGEPVTGEQYREFLRDPEGRQGLLILAIGAASRVGEERQAEREEAEGNSPPA